MHCHHQYYIACSRTEDDTHPNSTTSAYFSNRGPKNDCMLRANNAVCSCSMAACLQAYRSKCDAQTEYKDMNVA